MRHSGPHTTPLRAWLVCILAWNRFGSPIAGCAPPRHKMAVLLAVFVSAQVVAVYRDDGERGHHMQDYIPKEELAKFLAKCGDDQLQQQVTVA